MSELIGIPSDALAPTALLGIFVLMVFTGLLVPWRIHQKAEKTIEFQRKQLEVKDETIAEQARHMKAMEPGFQVVEKFGSDLQRRVEHP